jgi:TonB family protein
MKKLLVLIVLSMLTSIFAQTDEKVKLQQINEKTVDLYKVGNLDEALKSAGQAVELSLKVYGEKHQETALAYSNLGTLQREKGKFGDSAKNLQKALEIYRLHSNTPPVKIIDLYQSLAYSQLLNYKEKEAEANYLEAVKFSEATFGDENKELFSPSLNLAQFYARRSEFEKSDEYYLKTYRLAKQHFGTESKQVERVANSRICLNKDNKKRDKLFDVEYDKLFGIDKPKPEDVVNGKALKLIKPPYPQEAKNQRLTGTVKIKVKINEQGDVIEAASICSNGILETAALSSARMSKFSPTFVSGRAVQVTGVIVYNFSAQ